MQYADITVEDFIPHRQPFVMVDRLVSASVQCMEAELTVTEKNIFTENGVFSAAGLVEHIAQSFALGAGYLASSLNQGGGRIGFLTAVRNLVIEGLPKIGETIRTQVALVQSFENMVLFSFEMYTEKVKTATGNMKIFIQGAPNENFIRETN